MARAPYQPRDLPSLIVRRHHAKQKRNMKTSFTKLMIWAAILCFAVQRTDAETSGPVGLEVLKMKDVPEGVYEVQLQLSGRNQTVTLAIKNNQAVFVKSGESKLDGLKGEFELIGNGVFMARLAGDNHRATQFWVFHSDGTVVVKEIPDRGEKQTANITKSK
jgi:hypothetical protein